MTPEKKLREGLRAAEVVADSLPPSPSPGAPPSRLPCVWLIEDEEHGELVVVSRTIPGALLAWRKRYAEDLGLDVDEVASYMPTLLKRLCEPGDVVVGMLANEETLRDLGVSCDCAGGAA